MASLQPRPGTYALVLESTTRASVKIGRLGRLAVRRGFYVYIGSAFGPGGLRGRVGRHRKPSSNLHWHIDYLKAAIPLREVWCSYDANPREHQWAALLLNTAGAQIPLPGFGASDCRCPTHLVYFTGRPSLEEFQQQLDNAISDHEPVFRLYS
jgi:Uri superfamily endonuclease